MNYFLRLILAFSILFSNHYAWSQSTDGNGSLLGIEIPIDQFVGYSILSPEDGDVAYVSSCYRSESKRSLDCIADSEVLKTDLVSFIEKMRSNRYYRRIFNFTAQSTVGLIVGAAVVIFLSMAFTYWLAIPVAMALAGSAAFATVEIAATYGSMVVLGTGALAFNYSLDIFGAEEYDDMVNQLDGGLISSTKQIELFEEFLGDYSRPILENTNQLKANLESF